MELQEAEKLSHTLTGIAGEYFVAAELSMRGFMASITLRNNDSINIHASRVSDNSLFAVQVKTQQKGNKSWVLNQKSENRSAPNLFYIFVSLKGQGKRPDYYIVPSKDVAEYVKTTHSDWLGMPGKKGQTRNDSTLRKFEDKEDKYLEKWQILSGRVR